MRPATFATVTEDTSWSWRYKAVGEVSKTIELSPTEGVNVVSFVNVRNTDRWLSSDAYAENKFTSISTK